MATQSSGVGKKGASSYHISRRKFPTSQMSSPSASKTYNGFVALFSVDRHMGFLALQMLSHYGVEEFPSIRPACFVKLRLQVSFLFDGVVFQVSLQRFMCVVDHVESCEKDEDNPCDH